MSTVFYKMLQNPNLWEIKLKEINCNIVIQQVTYERLKNLYPKEEWKGDLRIISKLSVRRLWIEHVINNLKT